MKQLREYQQAIIDRIKDKKRLLLAVDMGLGKTISCLKAIQELIEEGKVKSVLIVGPKYVAQNTWPDEIKDWDLPLSHTIIKGNVKQREKLKDEDTSIHMINRENIVWLLESNPRHYDCIIWDESSSLKAAKLKTATKAPTRYNACLQFARKAEYVVLLSGTPTPNGIEDLYGQINVIKEGLLGKSKYNFMGEYFRNVSRNPAFPIYQIKKGASAEIMEIAEPYMFKLTTDKLIELPECLYIDKKVKLSAKELKTYKALLDDNILEDFDIVAVNAATLFGKLQQFTSGAVYKQDKTYERFHTAKIDALKELYDDAEANMLVFYNFQHEKDLITETFKDKAAFVSDENIRRWQAGELSVLFAHPAQIGHGLNLQSGGSVIVWLSIPTSLELYLQANKRLHRSGQKDTVAIYHMIAEGTIDERIINILSDKDKNQKDLLNVVKSVLTESSPLSII